MIDFWSLSNSDRRKRIEELASEGRSDLDRWREAILADGALDHSRSINTAFLIEPGSSVLDIGCGAMALKQYLGEGCTYTPCDIHDRGDGCIVVDLNKGEFPAGQHRYITMLGVLEYIYEPLAVLERASNHGSILLLDYNSGGNQEARRNCGWVSDLSPGDMVETLIKANWRHIAMRKVEEGRYLYICGSRFNEADLRWAWARAGEPPLEHSKSGIPWSSKLR